MLFGLSLILGTSSILFWLFPWNWIFPVLWATYLIYLRRWQPCIFLFAALLYGFCLTGSIGAETIGYFSPSSLKPHQSPFAKGLIYQGMLTAGGKKIPCTVHEPFKDDHPKANCDYILKGKLKKRGPYDYQFLAKEWIPVPKTFSLAELRFQMKEKLRAFLETKLKSPRVASFLSSLLTGDVEDRSLRYEFSKLGLQHILAISGFHFAILIAFASFFLNLFLTPRPKYFALLGLINIYFIFIGALPAVQRSYLTALFFLLGKTLNRHGSGLNLLGASLFIEVLFDPLIAMNLGFQLSFLSCFGILLFRPLFLPLATAIFPKHTPSHLTLFAQHGYLITSFLREALAITLSVNAALLPLILFYFHAFPLLSLLYNLFFPFLVSIALFLLLFALLLYFLFPPLSLFPIVDSFTAQLLDLTVYPPLFLDDSLRMKGLEAWTIPFYLFALFCISLLTNTRKFEYNLNHVSGDRSSAG